MLGNKAKNGHLISTYLQDKKGGGILDPTSFPLTTHMSNSKPLVPPCFTLRMLTVQEF